MGVQEAVAEASRRYVAERTERIAAEQAALAEKQAEAAEADRNADLDRRREEARRNGRMAYISKHQASGALGESALKANAASAALDVVLADPSSSVERLFTAWAAMQGSAAVHRALREQQTRYNWATENPGRRYYMGAYIDRTDVPSFADVLGQVIASRTKAAVKAVPDQAEFYEKATAAGEAAAKAVE